MHFYNAGGFAMSRYMIKARDPISSISHCIGAVFFALATVLLILKTLIWSEWSVKVLVGVILFGCSLVALYSASSIYHFFNGSQKTLLVLRKLDHAMIYVLIAGTYTPILLKYLAGQVIQVCTKRRKYYECF